MNLFVSLLALDYAGWCLLCLGLPRHYRQHFGREPSAGLARLLRGGGWAVSLAALVLAVHALGAAFGAVAWTAAWMLAAIAWVLLQPYAPRLARWGAALLPALALAVAGLA
jgi:hypothetical protein